ncbi:hypothetical protein ACJVDH_06005 [Pedobacter sp. AW1-32]|uniref:hypothetical protein n=1 Tax=Pedobacter sp. AW1-32 TaxID=3383026 RepID=UPI003FED8A2A
MMPVYNWDEGRYEDEDEEVSWDEVQKKYGFGKNEGKEKPEPPKKTINPFNRNVNSFKNSFDKLMGNVQTGNQWAEYLGGALEISGDLHSASMFSQGYRAGTSGNYLLSGRNLSLFGDMSMTSISTPISNLTRAGSTIGKGVTFISGALIAYEGYQTWNDVEGTSWGRFSYHSAGFGTSMYVGAVAGGPAGFTVGLAAAAQEVAYDTSKKTIMTLNGQWSNFVQSIVNATMGGR